MEKEAPQRGFATLEIFLTAQQMPIAENNLAEQALPGIVELGVGVHYPKASHTGMGMDAGWKERIQPLVCLCITKQAARVGAARPY